MDRLSEFERYSVSGWTEPGPIPPDVVDYYVRRGRRLRAAALAASLRALRHRAGRALGRLSRGLPSGAHGPGAIDMDCAHGRPC